jgi:hypothetical protein
MRVASLLGCIVYNVVNGQTWTSPACVCLPLLGTGISWFVSFTHLIVIDPCCSAVHFDEGIPHDIVKEWTGIQLAQDEAE